MAWVPMVGGSVIVTSVVLFRLVTRPGQGGDSERVKWEIKVLDVYV